MKKTIIKIIYTIVVFILALLLIGHFTNVETVDMTAKMGAPTFPTVTFELAGKQVNQAHGYASEMDNLWLRMELWWRRISIVMMRTRPMKKSRMPEQWIGAMT